MNKENNIDNISRDLLKAANITKAPESFTANIMSKIEAHKSAELTIIKPLISNGMWILIGMIALFTTIFALLFNKNTESTISLGKFPTIDFSFLETLTFSLPSMDISNITLLAIATFGIFFFIQVLMIDKNARTSIS